MPSVGPNSSVSEDESISVFAGDSFTRDLTFYYDNGGGADAPYSGSVTVELIKCEKTPVENPTCGALNSSITGFGDVSWADLTLGYFRNVRDNATWSNLPLTPGVVKFDWKSKLNGDDRSGLISYYPLLRGVMMMGGQGPAYMDGYPAIGSTPICNDSDSDRVMKWTVDADWWFKIHPGDDSWPMTCEFTLATDGGSVSGGNGTKEMSGAWHRTFYLTVPPTHSFRPTIMLSLRNYSHDGLAYYYTASEFGFFGTVKMEWDS